MIASDQEVTGSGRRTAASLVMVVTDPALRFGFSNLETAL